MNPRLFTKTREVILLKGEALTAGKKKQSKTKHLPVCMYVGEVEEIWLFREDPQIYFRYITNLTEKQNSADHVIHLKRKTTKTPCLKEIETPQ